MARRRTRFSPAIVPFFFFFFRVTHSFHPHPISVKLICWFYSVDVIKRKPSHCFWLPSPSTKCINWHFRFWPFPIFIYLTLPRRCLIPSGCPSDASSAFLRSSSYYYYFFYYYYYLELFLRGRQLSARSMARFHWWASVQQCHSTARWSSHFGWRCALMKIWFMPTKIN